ASAGIEGSYGDERTNLPEHPHECRVGPAVDQRPAGVRGIEAQDHAHRRRFAGAVRAEEAGDVARPHLEGEVVDRHRLPVALRECVHLDHGTSSVPSRMSWHEGTERTGTAESGWPPDRGGGISPGVPGLPT